jgi:hypothetical protein
MASRDPLKIINTTLTVAAQSYTVPANAKLTISSLTASNSTGSPRTISIHVVNSGGTPGAGNLFVPAIGITGGGQATSLGLVAHTLHGGDSLSFFADADSAVNLYISGYLQS